MPETRPVNLAFKPSSYFGGPESLYANIKGEERKTHILKMLELNMIDHVAAWVFAESLDDSRLEQTARINPRLCGGELLPDSLEGEIEIARIVQWFKVPNVISIRARLEDGTTIYRAVDEEDSIFCIEQPRTPSPITLWELIGLIDGIENFDLGPSTDFVRWLLDRQLTDDVSPMDLKFFVEVKSDFYPELTRWYRAVCRDWVNDATDRIKSERRKSFLLDPLGFDDNGFSSLHWAAFEGDIDLASQLVEHGVDIDIRTRNETPGGLTPLHIAAFSGHVEFAGWLLDHGADVNAIDAFGSTAAFKVEGNIREMFRLLMNRGASMNVANRQGLTILHRLATFGDGKLIEEAIAGGADVNAAGQDGSTPLHWAPTSDVVEALLRHGADPNAQTSPYGVTPIHTAIELEQPLDRIVGVNLASDDSSAEAFRYPRSVLDNMRMVDLLVRNGADVNAADRSGDTPLHVVASHEIAESLVRAGASVSARNAKGETPLHTAATTNRSRVIEVLIRHGADVEETTRDGHTPLHYATAWGEVQAMQVLLDAGADPNALDSEGDTPAKCALDFHRDSHVLYLRRGGNTPDHFGRRLIEEEVAND